MFKFSRSHIEDFWRCPRLRYLRYHHNGTGLERIGFAQEMAFGTAVHKANGLLLLGISTAEAISTALAEFDQSYQDLILAPEVLDDIIEAKALAEALIRAWAKLRLPYILEAFRVLEVEQEHEIELAPGLVWMIRQDALLERRADDLLSVLEFKTTGYMSDAFLKSWDDDMQTLSHTIAAEKLRNRPAASVLLEFLYKGRRYDGRSTSPLIVGYKKVVRDTITGDYTTEYSAASQRASGWQKFRVWEESFADAPPWMSPIEYWVEHWLDNGQLQAHLFGREVFRNEIEQEEWLKQTIYQEQHIRAAIETTASLMFFPQRRCRDCYSNKYNRSCAYRPICAGEVSLEDQPDDWVYKEREPHHPAENAD